MQKRPIIAGAFIASLILSGISPAMHAQDQATVPSGNPTLDSLLEVHYSAAAQERLSKVETLITTGKNVYALAGFESAFRIYQARPDKLRIEGDYQGSTVVETFNGEKAWRYAPAMGLDEPVEITGQELKTLLSQAQFENPLWNYKNRGATLELMPSPGEKTHHLVLTSKEGIRQHFYVDRESGLITAIRTVQMLGGSENEVEMLLKDYRAERGIPMAHRVETKMNGALVTTFMIEKVEVNKRIDPSLFEKPE
jgi:outer membrane lipoprotein-sorting protein